MGKHATRLKVPIAALEDKKFNFNYLTHYKVNSKGKTYHYVYEFGWMSFSDDSVLLVRTR
ncbi:MAG: hypothetical protein AAFQ02_06230 [Bacteroidota bacterium]